MSEKGDAMTTCPKCGACDEVLIWKPSCRLWYRPGRSGYTALVSQAGRYWRCDATDDVRGASGELELDTEATALTRHSCDVGSHFVNGLMHDLCHKLEAAQAEVDRLRKCVGDEWDAKAADLILTNAELWKARNAKLRGIVERLPKTADGVPVTDWTKIFRADGTPLVALSMACDEVCVDRETDHWECNPVLTSVRNCYSTLAAAEAARHAEGKEGKA